MNISMNSCKNIKLNKFYHIFSLVIPFGEKIVAKCGLKTVVFSGVLFLSGCFFAISLSSSYYLILSIYVLFIGPIYGILYVVPFLCSWRFFPLKSVEVNATLQAGYGVGAALFSFFAY